MNAAAPRFREFVDLLNADEVFAATAMVSEEFRWQLHDSGGLEVGRDALLELTFDFVADGEATRFEGRDTEAALLLLEQWAAGT